MAASPFKLVVVNRLKNLKIAAPGIRIVTAIDYLSSSEFAEDKRFRVFNLCDSYGYQSLGYYVSLLALARGHFVLPRARTLITMQSRVFVRSASEELDRLIQKKLKRIKSEKFLLSIYFGRSINKQYDELAEELSRLFPVPLLRGTFVCTDGHWQLTRLTPVAIGDIPTTHMPQVNEFANQYFNVRRHTRKGTARAAYDLAILVNESDVAPPSNARAIKKFIALASKAGLNAECISPRDLVRVPAYDALFIRENTNVYHHTFRFSSLAEAEGIAVIDSPEAILRCNNKVFLAELLRINGIRTPQTVILTRASDLETFGTFDFPVVLKLPDSSSSLGVEKAATLQELRDKAKCLFKQSDLIIAQEYTPTEFDWRIGILDGEALYACKYFMAKDHWQIYNWGAEKKKLKEGNHLTLPVEEAPQAVVDLALKASRLIGDGLFGVDLKVFNDQPMVIEVNENPNIDAGVEDQVLGDELYLRILLALRSRIDERYKSASRDFKEVS